MPNRFYNADQLLKLCPENNNMRSMMTNWPKI